MSENFVRLINAETLTTKELLEVLPIITEKWETCDKDEQTNILNAYMEEDLKTFTLLFMALPKSAAYTLENHVACHERIMSNFKEMEQILNAQESSKL